MTDDILTVTLSDGQKIEAMKRFRARYAEELTKLDVELTEILTGIAEADFLAQYLGDQPEITEMRKRKEGADKLQKRRTYLIKIIARLDEYIPQQKPVASVLPTGSAGAAGQQRPTIKRY